MIIDIAAYDENGNVISSVAQWDSNIYIYIHDVNTDINYTIDFFNYKSAVSYMMEYEVVNGKTKVKIPNILLQSPIPVIGLITFEGNETQRTIYRFAIGVLKRPYRSDTIYVDTEDYLSASKILQDSEGFYELAKAEADRASAILSSINSEVDGMAETYATKAYVNENGGKIDKITVNGREQSIVNKTVSITFDVNDVATSERVGIIKPGPEFDVLSDGTLISYKKMDVESVTVNVGAQEIGNIVTELILKWTLNKTPSKLTVNGSDVDVDSANMSFTGQQINETTTYTVEATDSRGAVDRGTTSINFYRYAYAKIAGSGTVPNTGDKKSAISTFKTNGATFNYTSGNCLWIFITEQNAKIQTNVLGQWADVNTHYEGAVNFTQANGMSYTYHAYRTDVFNANGTATYRIVW